MSRLSPCGLSSEGSGILDKPLRSYRLKQKSCATPSHRSDSIRMKRYKGHIDRRSRHDHEHGRMGNDIAPKQPNRHVQSSTRTQDSHSQKRRRRRRRPLQPPAPGLPKRQFPGEVSWRRSKRGGLVWEMVPVDSIWVREEDLSRDRVGGESGGDGAGHEAVLVRMEVAGRGSGGSRGRVWDAQQEI
ncbi:hypothetical protein AKJ16_DCAP20167 [Drosera capensis]